MLLLAPYERSTSKTIAIIYEIDNVTSLKAQMSSLANAFLKFSGTRNSQSIELVVATETSQFMRSQM